jgi:hypothetical protein
MGQLRVNLGPIPAMPGQLMDLNSIGAGDIVSGVAVEVIPPGVLCELDTNGLARPMKETAANFAASSFIGASIYDLAGFEQGYFPFAVPPSSAGSTATGYPIGAVVPFLRRGRIWMQYDGGGAPIKIGAVNVWSSSDSTHARGVLTFTATSGTAGAEIQNLATLIAWNPTLLAGSYTDGFGVATIVCGASLNLG